MSNCMSSQLYAFYNEQIQYMFILIYCAFSLYHKSSMVMDCVIKCMLIFNCLIIKGKITNILLKEIINLFLWGNAFA